MGNRSLQCPFCDNYLIEPQEIRFKDLEISGGICRCGAIYALDRTGHAMGEIFMDALTFACRGDMDRAYSISPDEYESVDIDYNLHTGKVGRGGRSSKVGKILFIRVKNHKNQ